MPSVCLQPLSAFSFSNLVYLHLQLTNQTPSFLLEVFLLDSVCHSVIKLTVMLEATTVCDHLLGPPQAQYCIQQTRLLHSFLNGYACFFSKNALGNLTGFRGSKLGKQNLTVIIPRNKYSESFIRMYVCMYVCILQSRCVIP